MKFRNLYRSWQMVLLLVAVDWAPSYWWCPGMIGVEAEKNDYYAENIDDYVAKQYEQQQQHRVADDYVAAYEEEDNKSNQQQSSNGKYDAFRNKFAQVQYNVGNETFFSWNPDVNFDGVSVMPISCIDYNNGHVIKYQLYDTADSYKCRLTEISTFLVSISHYMRAYFNYRALKFGKEFKLPSDAAFLSCNRIHLDGKNSDTVLYGKIGCMERSTTSSSTKLQLHLFTDRVCSTPYEDGRTEREHATKGYIVPPYDPEKENSKTQSQVISSAVSFRVPFYHCQSCVPDAVSGTFNKLNKNWYDDDYIKEHGAKREQEGQEDDTYLESNDDIHVGGHRRHLNIAQALPHVVEEYHSQFWNEYDEAVQQRQLYNNEYYDVGDWNMCQRVHKYGIWCNQECQAVDVFRSNQWSMPDIFLLSVILSFTSAMTFWIVLRRVKSEHHQEIYTSDDRPLPGLPHYCTAIMFIGCIGTIITLASLKFVNETLVCALIMCVVVFGYLLKLTLCENKRPVLLAAPRHDLFDSPLNDHLFD